VKETITPLTGITQAGEPPIDRRKLIDPFREDLTIPQQYRHTLADYQAYMEYGGSMGHNAPAGQHKTNMDIYSETFLLSNITPQEMVFNSGLWAIMENWCKQLGRKTYLKDITVITGSIPEYESHLFDKVRMNVPSRMFKIILFRKTPRPDSKKTNFTTTNGTAQYSDKNYSQIAHMEILIANNAPYYIDISAGMIDLSPYLLPIKSWEWFQRISKIDLNRLLEFYGFTMNRIKPFRGFINMNFTFSPNIKLLLKKSQWFGNLIYSPDIETLEYRWTECQKLAKEFEILDFHQQYYEYTKARLIRDGNSKSKSKSTSKYWYSSSKSRMKRTKHMKRTTKYSKRKTRDRTR
jgi:hypothetical protein